jgi:hypothetical protein
MKIEEGVFMKILRTDNSHSDLFKNMDYSFAGYQKKKTKTDEFREVLEQTISDQNEDWEEFRVLLPMDEYLWDNGYEDLE